MIPSIVSFQYFILLRKLNCHDSTKATHNLCVSGDRQAHKEFKPAFVSNKLLKQMINWQEKRLEKKI